MAIHGAMSLKAQPKHEHQPLWFHQDGHFRPWLATDSHLVLVHIVEKVHLQTNEVADIILTKTRFNN